MRALLGCLLLGAAACCTALSTAAAGPRDARIVSGAATIVGTGAGGVIVHQTTERAIIEWQHFDLGARQTIRFAQPNASAVTLVRVADSAGAAAHIEGRISANGTVDLVDRHGIAFGRSALVDAGSILATTNDIANAGFIAGKNQFASSVRLSASIVNLGRIIVRSGGYAAFVGAGVRNGGVVSAARGAIVALAGAAGFTLEADRSHPVAWQPGDGLGDRPLDAATNEPLAYLVSNSGELNAAGGTVSLTAVAARKDWGAALENGGFIAADSAGKAGGRVVLAVVAAGSPDALPAAIRVCGTISAVGRQIGSAGGEIRIEGGDVTLAGARLDATGSARGGRIVVRSRGTTRLRGSLRAAGNPGGLIDTSGQTVAIDSSPVDAGLSGQWLIDPYDLTVDRTAASVIAATLGRGTDVALETTASGAIGPGRRNPRGHGDILIDSPIGWRSSAKLALSADRDIEVNADIRISGPGALSLITGTGTTGDYHVASGTSISFTGGASSGAKLSIDHVAYTLLYDIASVQAINAGNTALGGHYALANPLDAAGLSNWVPIGTDGTGNAANGGRGFTGILAGLGNSVTNLDINLPSTSYVGLFGYSSGIIRDLGVVGTEVSGGEFVAALAGYSAGDISNAHAVEDPYSGGEVSGTDYVGGLVGENKGRLSGSSAAIAVLDNVAGSDVGGLVGGNAGTIERSFATGAVTDGSGAGVGGLAGYNSGHIADAYATGMVRAPSGSTKSRYLGGLVGYNAAAGVVARVNATGFVGAAATGPTGGGIDLGGVVGDNQGTITDGFWDIDTTGLKVGVGRDSSSDGSAGLSTASGASPFQAASYTGFDFGHRPIWNIVAGISHPYLQFEFSDRAPQVISGTGLRAPLLSSGANHGVPGLYGYTVAALVDGVPLAETATTGLNGYYELLVPPGTISANGRKVLAYLTGYPTGNSFFDGATGSITGLDIFGHFLTLYSGAGTVTSMAEGLARAIGEQSSEDFIFTLGPPPAYKLELVPDPLHLPRGSQFLIVSSADHLQLDQMPSFPSPLTYMMLIMARSRAAVTQTAPIEGGGRLSLVGKAARFALTAPANSISIFAAGLHKAAEVRLVDSTSLTIGSVNTVRGIDATNVVIDDAAGVKQSEPIIADELLLRGAGGVFSLINPNNRFGTLAGVARTVKVNDDRSLALGPVNGVDGVKADVAELGAAGNFLIGGQGYLIAKIASLDTGGKAAEDATGRIDAKLLNVSAKTGISLVGNNNILNIGTRHTDSGPDKIKQH